MNEAITCVFTIMIREKIFHPERDRIPKLVKTYESEDARLSLI